MTTTHHLTRDPSKSTSTWLSAALAAFGLMAAAPAQSPINWLFVNDLVDEKDVSTSGELCIAVNLGPEVAEQVINGVHFQADRGHWNKKSQSLGAATTNGVMYWPDFTSGGFTLSMPDWKRTDQTGTCSSCWPKVTANGWQSPDAAYNEGLGSGRHSEPGVQTDVNTIKGLTPGNTYQIQIWCAWSRTPVANKTQGTVVEWDNGMGGRQGSGGIYMDTNNTTRGQVATGIFVASANGEQTFTCHSDPGAVSPAQATWGVVNMVQIRDVSPKAGAARATYFGVGTPGSQTGGGRGPGLAHMYGTNNSPAINLTGHPVMGTSLRLTVENSSHQPSSALVVLGFTPVPPLSFLSGQLLVRPDLVLPVPMPWTIQNGQPFTPDHELQIPVTLPSTAITVYAQTLQLDSGAAGGVSFTPGIKIAVGT